MQKIFNIFTMPTPTEIANKELTHAQRELLKAQSAAEYATNMVNYHTARIRRLSKFQECTGTALVTT